MTREQIVSKLLKNSCISGEHVLTHTPLGQKPLHYVLQTSGMYFIYCAKCIQQLLKSNNLLDITSIFPEVNSNTEGYCEYCGDKIESVYGSCLYDEE